MPFGNFPLLLYWVGSLLRLLRALLLDFLYLFDQVVSLFLIAGAFVGAFRHVGLAAIKQIQISHGIVVIRPKLNSFLQGRDSLVHQLPVLVHEVGADGSGQGIAFFDLLINMVFVVPGPQLRVAAKRQRPIDHADPVIRLGIGGLQFDMLLMVSLGLLKFLRVKRLAAHLKQNRANAVNGAQIVRIFFQYAFEFVDGCIATLDVFFGRRAGYVLAGGARGTTQTRVWHR